MTGCESTHLERQTEHSRLAMHMNNAAQEGCGNALTAGQAQGRSRRRSNCHIEVVLKLQIQVQLHFKSRPCFIPNL